MNNNKTTIEVAKNWWRGIGAKTAHELRTKYYPGLSLLSDEEFAAIYIAEHPTAPTVEKEDSISEDKIEALARKQFDNAGFENIGDNLHCYLAGALFIHSELEADNKLLREALNNLCKVAQRETKDIIAWDGAISLDASIDRAKSVLEQTK